EIFQGLMLVSPSTTAAFHFAGPNSAFNQPAVSDSEDCQVSSVDSVARTLPSALRLAISPMTPAGFGLLPPLAAFTATTFFPSTSVPVTWNWAGAFQFSDFPTDLPLMKSSNELSPVNVATARAGRSPSVQTRRR